MITGEIKTKIDQIWDTFHVSGITNPITVLEQMTYIFFMKMLDDKQLQEEAMARDFDTEVKNPTFLVGQNWFNPVERALREYAVVGVPSYGVLKTCFRWFVRISLSLSRPSEQVRRVPTAGICSRLPSLSRMLVH